MADSFFYQPHVHTRDGVLTPDLVVDTLLLKVARGADPRPLGLNLLTTTRYLQDPCEDGCASAGLVLLSGGRGSLVTVGSAHWNPKESEKTAYPTEQLTPKPVAREAIRISHLMEVLPAVALSTFRQTRAGEAEIGRTALTDLPDAAELLGHWCGIDAPIRTAILISARHTDPEPRQATGDRVALTGLADHLDLELSYAVQRFKP